MRCHGGLVYEKTDCGSVPKYNDQHFFTLILHFFNYNANPSRLCLFIWNNDEATWMRGACKLEFGSVPKYDNYMHYSCDFEIFLS